MFIQEFINIKNKCLFCEGKMVPTLEKLSPASAINKVLKINNHYKKGYFNFRALSNNPPVTAEIDCITGEVDFKYPGSNDKVIDITKAFISASFNNYSAHVQVSCSNKKCDTYYYYVSTNMKIINNLVTGIDLSWESFNFEDSWVQNDWTEKKTKIFSTKNSEISPIIIDLIEFDSMPVEKLYKRIKTIIAFS